MKHEAPGILAWAVQGCLTWQKQGLGMPPSVKAATAAYREESDHVGEFLEDCCLLEPSALVSCVSLWKRYQSWVETNEELSLTQTTFGNRLGSRGFEKGKQGTVRARKGLKLKPTVP